MKEIKLPTRTMGWLLAGVMVCLAGTVSAERTDRPGNLRFESRVRVAHDDNVAQRPEDKQSSMRLSQESTLWGSFRGETTFVGLRYQLGLHWYEDRDDDNTDINHEADVTWNQTLSRRFSFGVGNTLRVTDRPELVREDGTIQRQESSYVYNSVRSTFTAVTTPRTNLDLSGRYALLRYDEDALADRDDYDLVAGGLTFRARAAAETSAFLDLRAESIDYIGAGKTQRDDILFPGADRVDAGARRQVPDRSADTLSAGLGIEQGLGADTSASIRGGVSYREFKAANTDSDTSPYVEGRVNYHYSPATRFVMSASYQLAQSSLISYVRQERTSADLRVSHDMTPRLQVMLVGGLVHSEYDREKTVSTLDPEAVESGSETAFTARARAAYRIGSNNWLEAGWQFTDLDSDLRDGYKRNVFDVAWRIRL